MSKIHYFQRFSQKENVVTNNTLLLFSRLYNHSPIRFNEFINQLLEGEPELNVGLNIVQQARMSTGKGVPDGMVSQKDFCILIETKLTNNFSIEQISRHAQSFRNDGVKIVLVLAPTRLKIEKPRQAKKNVYIKSINFEDVINAFNGVLAESDFEMKDIIEDYANFCDECNPSLLPTGKYTLRIVPCGITLETNFQYNMYYAPADRSFRDFDYLGIYKDKRVQGFGKLQKIIQVDIASMKFTKVKGKIENNDRETIKSMIKQAQKKYNHCRSGEILYFFTVDRFHRTSFEKDTRGGMYSQRYIDLRDYIKDNVFWGRAEDIAISLDGKTWR